MPTNQNIEKRHIQQTTPKHKQKHMNISHKDSWVKKETNKTLTNKTIHIQKKRVHIHGGISTIRKGNPWICTLKKKIW